MPQSFERPAGNRLEVSLFYVQHKPVARLVDAHAAVNLIRVLADESQLFLGPDTLLADAAHHVLDELLERDEPGDSAELIDRDGHLVARRAKLVEELGDALGLRHEVHVTDHVGHRIVVRELVDGQRPHDVLQGQDTDNVVRRVPVDGEAGVRVLGVCLKELLHAGAALDEDDLRAGCHNVAHLPVSEPEHAPETLRLVLLELSLSLSDVDEGAELSLSNRRLFLLRPAHSAAEHLRDPLENQDERQQQVLPPLERIGVQERKFLRVPDCNGLGNRLAQQQQRHRAEYGGNDHSEPFVVLPHAVDNHNGDHRAECHVD